MADNSASPIAKRDSWRTLAPGLMTPFSFHATFSREEYATITRGLIPVEMEDKWFVFWESDSLFLHRSWTGVCVYRVAFQRSGDRFEVAEAIVAANSEQYRRGSDRHEAALLDFVIRGLLLHQPVEFPMLSDVPASAQPGLYQHHIAGTGFPEGTLDGNQITVLARLKRLLGL
jgi:hypothetical protein